MARRLQTDRILFVTVIVLVLFGILMVFSASAVVQAEMHRSSYHYVLRQGAWAILGLALMFLMMNVDYRRLAKPTIVFPALGVQLILLVVVLFLSPTNNTHRWFRLGGITVQPSEFTKLVLVIFLAYFLELRKNAINGWRETILPIALILGMDAVLLLKEPDFGATLALVVIAAAMLYAAGLRPVYFVYAAIASVPILYVLVFHVAYRYKRIVAFLHPYADPLGAGFQIIQSYIAVGTGGIAGAGLMEGKEKLFFLPEPQTDFIFAVISEELGFLGAIFVVALFGIILWRGLRAAARCPNDFGRLLAVGLTMLVVIQALVNISVVVGLLPTKGIALPFISYGGSSLLMNLLAMGILLNIAQNTS